MLAKSLQNLTGCLGIIFLSGAAILPELRAHRAAGGTAIAAETGASWHILCFYTMKFSVRHPARGQTQRKD